MKFSVVEVKGFIIKEFFTGLGFPFFKKVVIYECMKFNVIKYRNIFLKRGSKCYMETYVRISCLLFEKFQLLRSFVPTVPLPIQPLHISLLSKNPAKVSSVLRLKKILNECKIYKLL